MDDVFFLDREFDAEIDLTPLIDVVFMLLVFFFMTSTFIRPAFEVRLPAAATAAPAPARGDEVVLAITEAGNFLFQGQPLRREDLPAVMRTDPDRPLHLYVDRAAPFGAFAVVLDEARRCGRENLTLRAEPEEVVADELADQP